MPPFRFQFRKLNSLLDAQRNFEQLEGLFQAGTMLDVRQDFGVEEDYRTGVSASAFSNITKDAAATLPLQLQYRPPVDAWWQVTLMEAIIRADVAVYGFVYASLLLTPAPVSGPARRRHLVSGRSDVNALQAGSLFSLFALKGGVAYTVNAQLGNAMATSSWSHYCGAEYLELSGKAWVR